MAADLDDGEFWLPSEFLVEDALTEKKSWGEENERRVCFPYKFGSFGSDLSSPVESVVSSTETESDEEEYLAGLTWQMAHTMLQGDEERVAHFDGEKTKRVMAGSPQSTLCAVGSLYGYNHGSSRSSPNGPSQVSSPPSTPMNPKEDAWDLLYEAAGQVVRMKMNEESQRSHGRGLLGPPLMPPQTTPYMSQPLSQQQLQNKQFQQLKQQQLMKQQSSGVWGKQSKVNLATQQQQILNRGRSVTPGYGNVKCARPLGLSSAAWPPLQKQNQTGSGMRAVFLAGSGARRESTGTGVFLPRRAGNSTEFRKKPACSTVLLPARVVQALNLNIDEMGTAHTRYHGNFVHHDEAMVGRTNGFIPQQQQMQKRDHIPFRPLQPPINQELRLPPEWTY